MLARGIQAAAPPSTKRLRSASAITACCLEGDLKENELILKATQQKQLRDECEAATARGRVPRRPRTRGSRQHQEKGTGVFPAVT